MYKIRLVVEFKVALLLAYALAITILALGTPFIMIAMMARNDESVGLGLNELKELVLGIKGKAREGMVEAAEIKGYSKDETARLLEWL